MGYEVHAVSSKALCGNSSAVCWHRANLLDSREVSNLISKVQPTHLLHFAWFTVPGKYWDAQENIHWVQASLDLMMAFTLHGGQRVVMAGSCAEYDWNYGYCSEMLTPLIPGTFFGTCKHALQMMLGADSRRTEISAAWGRIFYLYGPHENTNRLVASVVSSLLQNRSAQCSNGNQIRDYLYVEDVADAFVALLESNLSGPVNIGSGRPVAVREIISMIAEKLDKKNLVYLGAIPRPEDDPQFLVADTKRLNEEIGWLPRFDLDRGLDETISFWIKRLHEGRK